MNRWIGSIDIQETGLLWLINRCVFHPRGYALAWDPEKKEFSLLGDGSEAWHFELDEGEEDRLMATANAILARSLR